MFLQVIIDDEESVTPPPAKRARKARQAKPPVEVKDTEQEDEEAEPTRKVC